MQRKSCGAAKPSLRPTRPTQPGGCAHIMRSKPLTCPWLSMRAMRVATSAGYTTAASLMEWLGILCSAFLRFTGTVAAMVTSLLRSKSVLVASAYFDTATGIAKQRKKGQTINPDGSIHCIASSLPSNKRQMKPALRQSALLMPPADIPNVNSATIDSASYRRRICVPSDLGATISGLLRKRPKPAT